VPIQGAPFFTGGGTSVPLSSMNGVSAVPEPVAPLVALAALLPRRKRRRNVAR
jgi:MYXO-CTERM domain-containing protein